MTNSSSISSFNNSSRNTNNNNTTVGVGGGARTQTNGGTPAPKGMDSFVARGLQKRGLPPLGPNK